MQKGLGCKAVSLQRMANGNVNVKNMIEYIKYYNINNIDVALDNLTYILQIKTSSVTKNEKYINNTELKKNNAGDIIDEIYDYILTTKNKYNEINICILIIQFLGQGWLAQWESICFLIILLHLESI